MKYDFTRTCAAILFFAITATAATVGVPRELARERAREISNLRYRLSFTLIPHADSTRAHEEVRFNLSRPASLPIDFREGSVLKATVNGLSIATTLDNGHLVLPATALRSGSNVLAIDFSAPVGPAGKAITRFEDKEDGSEYLYTLFVPMDASMAFPCFDQPDLKARFTLEIEAPLNWTVISNAPIVNRSASASHEVVSFGETRPISTYLFAFAAGPFEAVHSSPGLPNVYVRHSQLARAQPEVPSIQNTVARGTSFLSQYFAQPFPFPKYEMVLIPGFAYGGMEHAGATFLREESVLFRTAPTENDRFNRSIILLHELAHQWFGDFVTMRWFDDLWLKEGFAEYMAFRTMASLEPGANVWKRFYQTIKPAAYGIDVTQGTTPIYQDIPNLKDAKSAYGAIVYSKAPGLLRQLAYLLGEDSFRDGLRLYLHEHAYGNAEWSDLVHALERSSGQNLAAWANDWIRRRGMPEVRVSWGCDSAGKVNRFTLSQQNVLGESGTWPLATEVLLGYSGKPPITFRAQFATANADMPPAIGKACPAYVFANEDDHAYGLFLLDGRSRDYTMTHIGSVSDLFERTLLWGALWDAVRFTELAPRRYLQLSLDRMPSESDEALLQSLTGRTAVALHRYVNPETRTRLAPEMERIASTGMLQAKNQDLRIIWFRALRSVAQTPDALMQLHKLLNGTLVIPGVQLRELDRWTVIAALLANGFSSSQADYAAEEQQDHTGNGPEYSYVAAAAKPDAANKAWYFGDYLHNGARPEDWVAQSLADFNYWNQSALTAPYLKRALDALPQIKQQRKIFFLVGWLNAFIGGQESPSADEEVHRWLAQTDLDRDLRLKVLQIVDDLDRTVKIRKQFP